MKKRIKTNQILFLGLFLFIPFFAFADHNDAHTIEQLRTQIQTLQIKLQKITGEISPQTPTAPPSCPNLSYDLYFGLHDYETKGQVSTLQKYMAQDVSIYPEGFVTGYYGPLTEQAVKRFQSRYGLLTNFRLDGSAIVDQITRAKISELCLTRNLNSSSTSTISNSDVFPNILSSSFIKNAIRRPDVYDYGPSIINDNGVYRMYWCSSRIEGGDSIWYARSSDGINWSDLRIVLNPTANSEEVDFEATGHTCDPSVIKVGRTYFLYYTAASFSGVNNEIFLARSSDGINWNKYPSNSNPLPVIKNTVRSGGYGIGQSAVFFLNGKFYHYFTNTDKGGEMLAFSTDGINWTIQNNNQPVFSTTNFIPVYLKDYNVFFAVSAHNELNQNDFYYSFSKDGITWNPKNSSDSHKISISGNRGSAHNAGILTDTTGNVSGSSISVFYGAGDSGTVTSNGFTNAGSWDIDISKINFTPSLSPSSPGSIQGFKVKMPGNQNTTPPAEETVRLDNSSPTTANYYSFTNVSVGNHTVSVTVPSGWSVGYTLCYSTQTNCGAPNDPNGYHGAAPISGSSVNVVIPAGGYADLWWHYTPSSDIYPPTLSFTASPTNIIKGQFSTLSWSSQNTTDCFASGGWSGSKPTNGVQSIAPALSNIYTLFCTGATGSATQNVTVKIISSSDTTPPSAPTSLNASALMTAVNLNWNASIDNVGVTNYRVYRNGAQIATVIDTKFEDKNISSGAIYTYAVLAADAAGNFSSQSSSVMVTIPQQTSPGSIQGFKVKMPGNQNTTPPAEETVRLDNSSPTTANYYSFTNVSVGNHTVSVTVPSGWSVGYTLCYSTQTNCGAPNDPNGYHGAAPISGSSVNVVIPAGGYADLWWHYTPSLSASDLNTTSSPSQPSPAISPLYRLYKSSIFGHFYTMNASELNNLLQSGYVLEGIAGYLYNIQQSETSPFYRLYHPIIFDYLYTANTEERDVVQKNGYVYQDVTGYFYLTQQTNTSPLYRMYSAGMKKHFYTMSASEKDNATQNLGYTFEGVAGYMFTSQTFVAAPGLFQTASMLNSIRQVLNEIRKIFPALNR